MTLSSTGTQGTVSCVTALLEQVAQFRRGQGEDHQARQHLDDRQHLLQLLPGADEEPDMLDRHHVLELRDGGARDGGHRLAGRIRDQMHVETQVACP